MIFNTKMTIPLVLPEKRYTFSGIHLYRTTFGYNIFNLGITSLCLTWKPGDPVEVAGSDNEIRATSTLLIDPGTINGTITDIYIPYATSINTFNTDRDVKKQSCFSSSTKIHVNQSLYNYMMSDLETWGDIAENIIIDQQELLL